MLKEVMELADEVQVFCQLRVKVYKIPKLIWYFPRLFVSLYPKIQLNQYEINTIITYLIDGDPVECLCTKGK